MGKDKEYEVMRFKWLADGCKTWDEAIERLEEMKKEIQSMKEQGYAIFSSSEDYLIYFKPELRKKREVREDDRR